MDSAEKPQDHPVAARPERTVRVVVADARELWSEGLAALLERKGHAIVGVTCDGAEALQMVEDTQPDVLLADLLLPSLDGVDLAAAITSRWPRIGVLVVADFSDEASVAAALRAGARGFVTRDAGLVTLLAALESVSAGDAHLPPDVQRRLIAGLAASPGGDGPDGLTRREMEVLKLIAAGLANGEIANRLVVGESTVKSHVASVIAKTGSRDRSQAVAYAFRRGLLR